MSFKLLVALEQTKHVDVQANLIIRNQLQDIFLKKKKAFKTAEAFPEVAQARDDVEEAA